MYTRISDSAGEKIKRFIRSQEALERSPSTHPAVRQIPQRAIGRFYNGESTAVPPYAILAVTGVQDLGDGKVLPKIAKPSTTFYRHFLVNGSNEVPGNSCGVYQDTEIVKVAYDTGTPAVDEGWGPKSGQWTLSKNSFEACLVVGIADATAKLLLARLASIDRVFGKLDGDLVYGNSATVSVWTGPSGNVSDSGANITAWCWLLKSGKKLIAGSWVICQAINGIFYVTESDNCPS